MPADDLLQWIDDSHYLLGGTTIVESDTGNTEPLPLHFPLTYLGYAVSPDHRAVAVAVKNYDTGTGQIWLIPFGGVPTMLYEGSLAGRIGEVTVSLAWGPNQDLYFDFPHDGSCAVFKCTKADNVAVFADNSSVPQPSPDGRLLAVNQTDSEGRGFGKAILDSEQGLLKRAGIQLGVVTWGKTADTLAVHLGGHLAIYRLDTQEPLTEVDLSGLVANVKWTAPDNIAVTTLTVEGKKVKGVESLAIPVEK